MRLTTILRRAGAALNPPAHPNDPGPALQLRDYPIARRPAGTGRARRA